MQATESPPPLDYGRFLESKRQSARNAGFDPTWMPDALFPFQRHLAEWAIRKGRAAIFADCGMGKSPVQLAWAENVVRETNRPVLVLAPIAVGRQTVAEGAKFGVECIQSRDGKFPSGARVVVTNYERLHLFDPADFAGCVGDESSCIKDMKGKRKGQVVEFMRLLRYRLLCTATAAPNDHHELGTSSEALGYLGGRDMLTKFFRQETSKDRLGWGRTKYKLRGHAETDFWRWACSWSRACRRPSDLGFDDGPFVLPELITREHEVRASRPHSGRLFDLPAISLQEQREEQRRTLRDRCEKAAGLVDHDRPAIAWAQLNDEGDLLERLIPDAVQVSGSDSDEAKEEKLMAFVSGQARVLVSKCSIAGFGLNFQHCAHQTFFPSHSFEQYYQGVRRSWRFGQKSPVVVDLVTTEGGAGVLANLREKAARADRMFAELVRLMNDAMTIERTTYGETPAEAPSWLASTRN